MTDCSICCEKFNCSNRMPIKCKTCEDPSIKACQSCCKKYILDSVNDPKCMICSIEWDQEFLHDNFTKTFISKELKAHKENVLFERQVARLPESQQDAQKQLLIEGMEKQRDFFKQEQLKRRLEYQAKLKEIEMRKIDALELFQLNANYTMEELKYAYKIHAKLIV